MKRDTKQGAKAVKHDAGKPQMSLISSLWLFGVAQVLTFGVRKYSAHNWRRGLVVSRQLDAALRHIWAFVGGEDFDPESGLSHLYHASCCIMFAAEICVTHPELDDRYKIKATLKGQGSKRGRK